MHVAQSQGTSYVKVITQLLNTEHMIMPFVIDPFGQWGPVAKFVLYSKCENLPGWINEGGTKSLELQMQSAVGKYVLTIWNVGACKQRMEAYSSE